METQTQADQIEAYLLAGGALTQLQSLERFKCLRLGARAWDLRQKGINVQSRIVETPSGKHIAEYFVPPDAPLITPAERKKEKSITLTKLRSLAREVANGDLLTELAYSKLLVAAEKA